MEKRPRLIVHIGHGKTGTTSIQTALSENAKALAAQKAKYLGIVLENCTREPRKPWQSKRGSSLLFDDTPASEAVNQIYDVLIHEMETLKSKGIETAIWSNEYMLERPSKVLDAFVRLRDQGFPVTFICYLRRHDAWMQSAYLQWGLKNKTNKGPLKTFDEWKKAGSYEYFRNVEPWLEAFHDDLRLINFDAAGDAVSHFVNFVGLRLEQTTENSNVTPTSSELAAWAVFNARFEESVPVAAFERIVQPSRVIDKMKTTLGPFEDYLPSAEQLESLVKEYESDISKINDLLDRQGEPELSFAKPVRTNATPSGWEMDQFMLKMIFALQEQVFWLRNRVTALEQRNDGDKT